MSKSAKCKSQLMQSKRVTRRRQRPPHIYEQTARHILEQAVTHAFGIDPLAFWSPNRGHPRVALARQVGMYLAHILLELSLTEVGRLFARDRTTVAHACCVVEDRRDDRTFDRALDLLESAVRLLRPQSGRKPSSAQAGPLLAQSPAAP